MGISILELVLRRLRQAKFTADVAYPGQKFPEIKSTVAAASLFALAAMNEAVDQASVEEFKAGDLTVKQSTSARDAASRCLYHQAELMITPYLKDRFSFAGV